LELKKVEIPIVVGNLQAGKFLKYWKKPEHSSIAIKSAEKKDHCLRKGQMGNPNKNSFLFGFPGFLFGFRLDPLRK
jgi:hypothetical protein